MKSSLSAWLEYYDKTHDLHWLLSPTVMLVKLAFFAGYKAAELLRQRREQVAP